VASNCLLNYRPTASLPSNDFLVVFDLQSRYLCVVYSGLVLYFDLTICLSYIVKPVRLSLVD